MPVVITWVNPEASVAGQSAAWTLQPGVHVLGRAPDCALSIPDADKSISRQHLQIEVLARGVQLLQLGANPSLLNGLPIGDQTPQPWTPGDLLEVEGRFFELMNTGPAVTHFNPMAEFTQQGALHTSTAAHSTASLYPNHAARPRTSAPVLEGMVPGLSTSPLLDNLPPAPAGSANLSPASAIPDHWDPFSEPLDVLGPAPALQVDNFARGVPQVEALHHRHHVVMQPSAPAATLVSKVEARAQAIHVAATPPSPVSVAPAAHSPAPGQEPDAWVQVFLEALGVPPSLQPKLLTTDMAACLGQTLQHALEGQLSLLSARALFKNEVHVEHTTIQVRDNNPLKHCPSVQELLNRAVNPATSSYMPLPQAVLASNRDLLTHQQVSVLALKTCLQQLARELDPRQFEGEAGLVGKPWYRSASRWRWMRCVQAHQQRFDNTQDPFAQVLSTAYQAAYAQLQRGVQAGRAT